MTNALYPVIARQAELPMYLTGVGENSPEYHVRRESGLVSHQLLITTDGEGVLEAGGQTYRLDKGSIFYIAPSVPHEYYPNEGGWHDLWLVFRGGQIDALMKSMGFDGTAVVHGADISALKALHTLIMKAAGDPVSGGERCSLLLYEFILEARRAMGISDQLQGGDGIAQSAVRYINEHFSKDITLEELSSLSGVSMQHFCRVFRAHTGMRPMEYLANRRISEAKLLLVTTDAPVSRIAGEAGFSDQNYFGIVFKRFTGLTPTSFRRQRR